MLETILTKCDERYGKHTGCRKGDGDCKFCGSCTSCGKCIQDIHYGNVERTYDCPRMADYYTCRFSCKYATEIFYAISCIQKLRDLDTLKVLSLGCGPCTDLFAIKNLRETGILSYTSLEYKGIDCGKDTWIQIHDDIQSLAVDDKIEFVYSNVQEYIQNSENNGWMPNLVVIQYMFSDMKKHDTGNFEVFVKCFADYFNSLAGEVFVVINDINRVETTELFDKVIADLANVQIWRCYFDFPKATQYGKRYQKNEILFDSNRWADYTERLQPTCSSAQAIIYKTDI